MSHNGLPSKLFEEGRPRGVALLTDRFFLAVDGDADAFLGASLGFINFIAGLS